MLKRNLIVLGVVVALVLAVVAASLLFKSLPELPEEVNTTVKGYVYIAAGDQARWFELPAEEASLTVRRTAEDGSEISNTVTLTPEGVYMAHSTCENQDCVMQGYVTFANKATRPLKNTIVCLPNDVIIELYSIDEMTLSSPQ